MSDWKAELAGVNPGGDSSWLESYLRETQESRDAELYAAFIALIETLDELDRLGTSADDPKQQTGWSESLRVLRNQVRRRLADLGLKTICSVGQLVDPRIHNVVETVESGGPPATIVREMRAGYLYRDQLLRPAWVVSVRSDNDGMR